MYFALQDVNNGLPLFIAWPCFVEPGGGDDIEQGLAAGSHPGFKYVEYAGVFVCVVLVDEAIGYVEPVEGIAVFADGGHEAVVCVVHDATAHASVDFVFEAGVDEGYVFGESGGIVDGDDGLIFFGGSGVYLGSYFVIHKEVKECFASGFGGFAVFTGYFFV